MRRLCSICKVLKNPGSFYPHKKWLRSECKKCSAKQGLIWHEQNHTSESYRNRMREAGRRARLKPKNMYRIYKNNAIMRGIKWFLTYELFLTYWRCPCTYCGLKIETIGLDRKENEEGYIIGNIVPCCKDCNYMKRTVSTTQFLENCKRIVNYTSLHGSM